MKKPTNPIIGWMCFKCYDYKSDKHNFYIHGLTLKCSLCDVGLKYENYTRTDGTSGEGASCPNCNNSTALPQCLSCEGRMQEYGGTLKELKDLNPIDREYSIEIETASNKLNKPWWKF